MATHTEKSGWQKLIRRARIAGMSRGRDKIIQASDIGNMSPRESSLLATAMRLRRVKVRGTAVVRDANGNAKYTDAKRAGQYGEENVG